MSNTPRYRPASVGGCTSAILETRADRSSLLRSPEALQPYPARLTDRLEHWANLTPDRTFAAQRVHGGDWQHISYAKMLARARSIGQSLVERGLDAERPIAILSGNDLDNLSLTMGAMWAGVPFTPISTAYSLLSSDFGKLRHILATVTPGLVFASSGDYARAIDACVREGTEVVTSNGNLAGRPVTPFGDLLSANPIASGDAAHARVGPDTIAKFLFTSGSTRQPKGVINTQRMLCANQQMLRQCLGFLGEEPPVLVDWLPWNHTFGSNHNIGMTLYNGGTLYIDEGKPTPGGMAETLRNLREISPTMYFNVPKGLEAIADAMDHDHVLRASLYRRLKAFKFAGASLSQAIWDRLDAHAEAAIGERIRIVTGLGMTETSPSCVLAVGTDTSSGGIGLPIPGVDVKLVPVDGKTEIRFKGPNVTPGYWRAPEPTAAAFDEEGYYRTGDAVRFVDDAQPLLGLRFDGRLAEDFKLSTGTFVSVGPLCAKIRQEGHPCVLDVVVTGIDRDQVGVLVFPHLDACRSLAGLGPQADTAEVVAHAKLQAFFQGLIDRLHHAGTGSANRPMRLGVLLQPPSIDRGEITDKGSINQRAVLDARAHMVAALYADPGPQLHVFTPLSEASARAVPRRH